MRCKISECTPWRIQWQRGQLFMAAWCMSLWHMWLMTRQGANASESDIQQRVITGMASTCCGCASVNDWHVRLHAVDVRAGSGRGTGMWARCCRSGTTRRWRLRGESGRTASATAQPATPGVPCACHTLHLVVLQDLLLHSKSRARANGLSVLLTVCGLRALQARTATQPCSLHCYSQQGISTCSGSCREAVTGRAPRARGAEEPPGPAGSEVTDRAYQREYLQHDAKRIRRD